MHLLVIALSSCFLFFCPPHKAVARRSVATPSPACEKITLAYAAKTGSRDDFVKSFPVHKQRSVLKCIGDE